MMDYYAFMGFVIIFVCFGVIILNTGVRGFIQCLVGLTSLCFVIFNN